MTNLTYRLIDSRLLKKFFKSPWIGIYATFSDALAAIPSRANVGHNQDNAREIFASYPVDRVRPADYPIMLHLRELLRPGVRLIDLGGNIGMAYYTARKYFKIPSPLEWVLVDVPQGIEAAKRVAIREGDNGCLRFATDLREAGRADIFFSSGTLQFIEPPLPSLLAQLPDLPQAVLINRIPVWDRDPIATMHDIGFCMTPYQVFNRQAFIRSMEQAGYRLADSWTCPESTFSIRFHPRLRLNAYQGFFFSRAAQNS